MFLSERATRNLVVCILHLYGVIDNCVTWQNGNHPLLFLGTFSADYLSYENMMPWPLFDLVQPTDQSFLGFQNKYRAL